jgi:hypothetical protein
VARALGADAELLSADEQWGTTTSSSSGSGTRAESDGGMELEIGAAIGAAGAAATDELPADIMQRRAPPRSRAFPKRQEGVIRRPKLPPYGLRVRLFAVAVCCCCLLLFFIGCVLHRVSDAQPPWLQTSCPPHQNKNKSKDEEITPALADELAALHAFSTGRFYGQRVAPVSAATVRTDVRYLKLMLGWLVRHRGVDVSEVSLRTMFPSADEAAIAHTFDFTQFLVNVAFRPFLFLEGGFLCCFRAVIPAKPTHNNTNQPTPTPTTTGKQERHAGPRTVLNALSACLHTVRFLYHDQSKVCYVCRWRGGGGLVVARFSYCKREECTHNTCPSQNKRASPSHTHSKLKTPTKNRDSPTSPTRARRRTPTSHWCAP